MNHDDGTELAHAISGGVQPWDWNPRYAEFARRLLLTPETCVTQVCMVSFSFWIHRELQRALVAWAPCCAGQDVRLNNHGIHCLPEGHASFDRWLRGEACDPNPEWMLWYPPSAQEPAAERRAEGVVG